MKRQHVFVIGLIVVSVIAVIILSTRSPGESRPGLAGAAENRVVVITLNGTIQEAMGGFTAGGITPRGVRRQLEQASADSSVHGVVLRLETPGGSIAASQEIASMIRDYDKPLVVSMADMAASGGYYISAPAQGIVAHPGTLTGSIGVISTLINPEGLYDLIGLEVETIKSGKHKDMFSRTLTVEEKRIMQGISDGAYDQFVAEVAEGRKMSVEEVRTLATGQLYLGSQALELGLVDRLGGVEEAINYLAELNNIDDPVRYEYPPPSMFTQFFEYGYQVLGVLEKGLVGPELIMLDMVREGFPPDFRYQVR